MLSHTVLLALVAAVGAVPLNINLGAYSPALVVGDGEISVGGAGAEGASALMATLAQGARQGAAEGAAPQQGRQEGQNRQENAPPAEGAAPAGKRSLSVRDIADFLTKREVVPTADEHIDAVARAVEWIKRDLNSFNAALGYAERAQKDQPKVELGTGEKGAGVGIVVNAGTNVQQNSAANGAKPAGAPKTKRSEVLEESDSPKTTLVAITEI